MIATCNVGFNRVPAIIYESPTIQLYPVYEKQRPMQYFGKTEDGEGIKKFIDDFMTNDFTPVRRRNSPKFEEFKMEEQRSREANSGG
jgi:hypothetical protein